MEIPDSKIVPYRSSDAALKKQIEVLQEENAALKKKRERTKADKLMVRVPLALATAFGVPTAIASAVHVAERYGWLGLPLGIGLIVALFGVIPVIAFTMDGTWK